MIHPAVATSGRLLSSSGLAKREAVGLGAWFEEADLESAVSDGAGLADELVGPLLRESAAAVGVKVRPVALAGWLAVE